MEDILFSSHLFKVVKRFQKGRSGKKLERHVVLHPGAVTILPVLPDRKILLERQYRIALDEHILELPAGTREPGEDPLLTAKRELEEETGYIAGKIEKMMTFFPSPGIMREEMHLFLAENLLPGKTAREDGEDIELVTLNLDEALEKVRTGEIKDAKTIIGLLFYAQSVK